MEGQIFIEMLKRWDDTEGWEITREDVWPYMYGTGGKQRTRVGSKNLVQFLIRVQPERRSSANRGLLCPGIHG